jgi:glycosyltransferase involved in cell wall biosynthesis
MRVLLVNDRSPAAGSGVEVHLGVLAGALEVAGDTVELFAGEIVHRGPGRALDIWDPWARRALGRVARGFRPDVVHHHNVVRELSVSVLGVPRDAACVLSVHDVRLLTGAEGIRPPVAALPLTLAKRAKGVLDRSVARRTVDVAIGHSDAIAARLQGMGFAAVRQAPPTAAVPSSDVLRPPSSTSEILYAGRLSPEKGVDVLLDAFARVVAAHPDARLVVAGDGPDRQALQARAAHTRGVEFTGVLERPDLEARMGRARAVAVPSLGAEGGPVVVVEAALAGRPTIVSDVPGAADLVVRHGNGFVVRPGDVAALTDAIAALLDDPEAADRLGGLGRIAALAHYSPDAAVGAVRAAYRDAIVLAGARTRTGRVRPSE